MNIVRRLRDHVWPWTTREIHLTFDDGPNSDVTPYLLSELASAGIHATFFVIGKNLLTPSGQTLLTRIAEGGHSIGNHTFSHPDLTRLSPFEIGAEIRRTAELIGDRDSGIKLFRPPYGFTNKIVTDVIIQEGYRSVLWNVDSLDWKIPHRDGPWVEHAILQIKRRRQSVVLNHENHLSASIHVPRFISELHAIGSTKVTRMS